MNEYIFDGKPHALNEEFGYITEKFDEESQFLEIESIKRRLVKEYVRYRTKSNDEECLEVLVNHFLFKENPLDYSVVYKPAWIVSVLSQKALLSVKFKRYPNDGLDDEDKKN